MPSVVITRRGLGLGLRFVGLLALAGCMISLPMQGVHQLNVLEGTVKIRAPRGYCIDKNASASLGPAIVVLIGRCAAWYPVAPAVVTLTIGAPASAGVLQEGPDVLARYFASEPGRGVLARDGDPTHVEVIETRIADQALLLHVRDLLTGEYWRAITAIKGRLVTISASGVEGAPLASDRGLKLVEDTMQLLVNRNPVKPEPAPLR